MRIEHSIPLNVPSGDGFIYDNDCAYEIIDQVKEGNTLFYSAEGLSTFKEIPMKNVSGSIIQVFVENGNLVFDINVFSPELNRILEIYKNRGAEDEIPIFTSTSIYGDVDVDTKRVVAKRIQFNGVFWKKDNSVLK